MKGQVKEQWGKLTDDEIDVINGRIDQLVGKLQEKYAFKSEEVEKDVRGWYEKHFAQKDVKAAGRKIEKESLFSKLRKL